MADVVKFVIAMDDKASAPVKKLSTQTDKLGKSAKQTGTNYAKLGGQIVAFAMAVKGAAVLISLSPIRTATCAMQTKYLRSRSQNCRRWKTRHSARVWQLSCSAALPVI